MNRKFAVVTGAGSGIGRALTRHLASLDLDVLAVGRRSAPLEETRATAPDRISLIAADVSMPEGRRKILRALGPGRKLSYLVHNAGLLAPVSPLSNVILADWRYHMSVNVEGPVFLTQALLERMTTPSRILHISSGAAHNAYEGWGAYCASKSALHMVYRIYDQELRERQIRVGSVRPGVVNTPMQDEVRTATEDVFPQLPKFQDLKKNDELGNPEDVARFLAWLLLETEPETYAAEEWDIRDQPHDAPWR